FRRTHKRGLPAARSAVTSISVSLSESDASFWVSACSQASLVPHPETGRDELSWIRASPASSQNTHAHRRSPSRSPQRLNGFGRRSSRPHLRGLGSRRQDSARSGRWRSGGARLDEARGLEFVPNGDSHNGHRGAEPEPPRGAQVELGYVDHDESAVVALEKQIRTGDPVYGAAEGH